MTTKKCPNYRRCRHFCDQYATCCRDCYIAKRQQSMATTLARKVTPAAAVQDDLQERRRAEEHRDLQARYKALQGQFEEQQRQLSVVESITKNIETYRIRPSQPSGTSEATVVVAASDWHSEELVGPELGILRNRFTPKECKVRAERFFQKAHRLTNLLAKDIKIDTMVLALLGDFITNSEMHDGDNAENCAFPPMVALDKVQEHLASGIDFLLAESKRTLVIPCHSGNHARTTRKVRFSAENGHSVEYFMYKSLAKHCAKYGDRVQFIIPEGPHSYLRLYDKTVRFQHGHMVKYGGGVGGIYIPVNKAIAQWNKAAHADIDIFGHFHQNIFAPNFICNGSLIGYNGFALSIKADYEPPIQALTLFDRKRGKTCMWPIYVGGSK